MVDKRKSDVRLFDNLSGMQHDNLAGYYLIHGDSHEKVARELRAVYDNNIRSVVIESRFHPDYCRDKYFSDIRFMLEECRKLGLRAWLMDDSECPSGTCNFMLKEPEYIKYRPWEIREFHLDVAGPITDGNVAANCWLKDESESILSVVAVKHIPNSTLLSAESVDLTGNLHDEMVYFDLGEGVWRIFFLIKTRQNTLPLIDKLREECTEFYINQVHQKIYDNLSEYFGNTLLGFFNDEAGFHNNTNRMYITPMGTENAQYPWGDCVLDALKDIYGDKAYARLLGIWYRFEDGSEQKLRVEYMDTISQAFYNNYSKKIAEFCHEHGVRLIGHILEDGNGHAKTGYGCGHYFRAIGDQDMSGIDTVLHQHVPGMTECSHKALSSFGHHDNVFYTYYLAKLGASYAHIDSRKKGRLMCEIYGAYGYAEGTKMMKYIGDHMLVRGVNYMLPCLYSSDDTQKFHHPPVFYSGGKNPLYPHYGTVMNYLNRVCHMLTDGIHVPSCAIFYDAHGHWVNEDFLKAQDLAKVLYDNHFDYDILPIEYIEQIDKNGMLNGEKYPLLFLPYTSYLPESVIKSLKKANIEVICVSDNGQKSADFPTIDIKEAPYILKERGVCDVVCDYQGIYLRSYHYTRDNTHIYMFVNEDIKHKISTDITLRAFDDGNYAIYDALENKAWRGYSDSGKIHIDLPPYSSLIILCGELEYERLVQLPELTLISEETVSNVFDVSLAETLEKYEPYIKTDKLFNVTGRAHKPRFSGNIRYETTLNLKKADKIMLDLGEVGEAATVKLNGKRAGNRIAPPYIFDITDLVKNGENNLEIIVSNHLGYNKRDYLSIYLTFEPSGLLGPVKIKSYNIKK
ncbi:MAG: hypothetical protein J6L59_00100 [Clostridia bacterium]|nr:hypothetical protein [Clostridia bacterium]